VTVTAGAARANFFVVQPDDIGMAQGKVDRMIGAKGTARRHAEGIAGLTVDEGHHLVEHVLIVLHVALNTWTNYINEVAKTDIDFPVVSAPGVCDTALPTREDTTAGYPAAL